MQLADGNPVVVGFVVEQACLSAISRDGIGVIFRTPGKKPPKSMSIPVTIFHDANLFGSCSRWTSETLLVPSNPFYHDIDAIYVNVNAEAKSVDVCPIQITIRKRHPDSESRFYNRWQLWKDHYQGFTLKTTFIRVVEDGCYLRKPPPRSRGANSCSHFSETSYTQVCVPVKTLCPQIGAYLEIFRHQRKASNTSIPLQSHPDFGEQSHRKFKRPAAVPLEKSMDLTTGVDMGGKRARKQRKG
jgi:hypothetical protein